MEKWKELRKPFPAAVIGKIPKGGTQLDYVGHAAVTDRLLEVDPTWTWEPAGKSESGYPELDKEENLWIILTVNGVSRYGVGDGKNMKERIGDAIRNAAMRFGVALDLWTKEELESHLEHPEEKNQRPSDTISDAQRKMIFAILREKGYVTQDEQRLVITELTGSDSTSGLTKTEASGLIEALGKL